MPPRALLLGSLRTLALTHLVTAPLTIYFLLWPAVCWYGFDLSAPAPCSPFAIIPHYMSHITLQQRGSSESRLDPPLVPCD